MTEEQDHIHITLVVTPTLARYLVGCFDYLLAHDLENHLPEHEGAELVLQHIRDSLQSKINS
jgi:hypothetical protein